tara:strand:+ start:623 stop:736 length:114 start_codon:yes stop_codon:yes gene_type:complete
LFVLGLHLFFCPLAVRAEEIAQAPLPDKEEVLELFEG